MSVIKEAVFIRHKLSTKPAILEDLWRKREIALHYENLRSINPDDYRTTAAKNALKRLHSYCKTGVIVGAFYKEIRPAHCLVGIIPQGSTIQYTERYGEDFIYKVVKLDNAKEISLENYPILGAIQPRLTAISKWPGAFDVLRNIALDRVCDLNVNNLSPGQLEVICHEYLRMKGLLNALLLPIGRSLQDVDIWGIGSDGCSVLAQVTHATQQNQIDMKFGKLKEFNGQKHTLIFFGPQSSFRADIAVKYISIESVFADLCSSQNAVYSQMLDAMLNR